MAYRQETESSCRWGGFKLETSFEWGTTRICTRAYLVFIYINDLEEGVTSNILKFADYTNVLEKLREIGINNNCRMTLIH